MAEIPRSTLVEKIASLYADRDRGEPPASAGSVLRVRPRHVLLESEPFPPPEEVFDERQGVRPPTDAADPARWMLQEGFVIPGCFCAGTGAGVHGFGAVSALSAGLERGDVAEVLRTGRIDYVVPASSRLRVAPGEEGASIASRIHLGAREFPGHAIEVIGDLARIPVEERVDLAERGVSDGAAAVLFPWDEVLRDWFDQRAAAFTERGDRPRKITEKLVAKFGRTVLAGDAGANYAALL